MAERNEADVDRIQGRMTATGLQLGKDMAFDTWVQMGRRIAALSNASGWWLGDWLVYGERNYGRRYREASDATSLDYQTLRNYAWVARRFLMSRRRDSLSIQHHAEVAALSEAEQDLWLSRAERLGWSRNELRRQLSIARRGPEADRGIMRLRVAGGRRDRWSEAAAIREQPLEEWIVAAADAAADAALAATRAAAP